MAVGDNITTVVIGKKKVGKSTFLNSQAEAYAKKTGMKVLVVDVNGAPAYAHHQLLSCNNFPVWCKGNYNGVKRFYLKDKPQMMDMIVEHFRDGLIIFEDCTKYIRGRVPDNVMELLVDHRMWNADIIYTFHSLMKIPPSFWDLVNLVTVFKTNDVLEGNDNKYNARVPNYPAIKKAMIAQRNNKTPFAKPIIVSTDI